MADQLPDGVTLGPVKTDGPTTPSVLQSQSAPPPVGKPFVPSSTPATGLPPGVTLGSIKQDGSTTSTSDTPPPGPTAKQAAYQQATASGPYAPAGGAEKAMGAEIGDNKAQEKEALKDTAWGTAETVGGIAGASAIPELAGVAEGALQISETALQHLAENYPQLTKLASKLGYGAGAAGAYKLLNKLGWH